MGLYQVDKKILKRIFNQISGKVQKDDELIPELTIGGAGHMWCFDPSKNQMVRIIRGIKCYALSETKDEFNRILVYTVHNDVILIEEEEIIYTGYN
tara:strand:+ start:1178 stop:1465 length:288 start_codon:yes stop_codon:yes gene_type:complete